MTQIEKIADDYVERFWLEQSDRVKSILRLTFRNGVYKGLQMQSELEDERSVATDDAQSTKDDNQINKTHVK